MSNPNPSPLPFLDEAYLRPYFDIIAPTRRETPVDIQVQGGRARMVRRRRGPFHSLELPGEASADYSDLCYDSPESGSALLETIVGRRDSDVVVLRNLPGTSSTIELAVQLARQRGWLLSSLQIDQAPYVELEGTWETFSTSRRDRKSRYNLRRAARQLNAMGSMQVVHYTQPGDVDAHLEDAFRLYTGRQRGRRLPWGFEAEVGRRFYRAVALAFARQGAMDLAFLQLDGVPVAFAYSLKHQEVYYYYKVGVTDSAEVLRFSPGAVLLENLLERAFADRLQRFDFMLGGEPYKALWATAHNTVHTLALARREPRSAAAWLLYGAKLRLRERVRQSPTLRLLAERVLRVIQRPGSSTKGEAS